MTECERGQHHTLPPLPVSVYDLECATTRNEFSTGSKLSNASHVLLLPKTRQLWLAETTDTLLLQAKSSKQKARILYVPYSPVTKMERSNCTKVSLRVVNDLFRSSISSVKLGDPLPDLFQLLTLMTSVHS